MAGSFRSPSEKKQVEEQLKIDEGYKLEIYKDSEGYPTFGIGHLITPSDPEHKQPIGSKVEADRVQAAFAVDVNSAVNGVLEIFPQASSFPSEVKQILVNMVFNLGTAGLRTFKKFIAAVNESNWTEAAKQMVDSKWYGQVGKRAERLVNRMKAVAGK